MPPLFSSPLPIFPPLLSPWGLTPERATPSLATRPRHDILTKTEENGSDDYLQVPPSGNFSHDSQEETS